MFKLRFDESEIPAWAAKYAYIRDDEKLMSHVDEVRRAGKLKKPILKQVTRWKSPRSSGHVDKNSDAFVEEVTAFAFSAGDERARITTLTLLDGVSWPTASVILHLFHTDPYPILDVRALWSLNAEPPAWYTFQFWWPYVEYYRGLYVRTGLDPRTVDRALWQYSKSKQTS